MRAVKEPWRRSFVKMLDNVTNAAKPDKEVFGFPIPSVGNYYPQVKKAVESNLMPDFQDLRFIPGTINPGPQNPNAGNFFSLQDGDTLQQIDESKLRDAKVIVSPGLGGGDSDKQLKHSLQQFKRLFPQAVIYSPLKEGELRGDRYIEGLHYYENENYINEEESRNFFNKAILPRITDSNDKLLKPEEVERFTLVGFSIGSRENRSHLEFMYEFLLKNGVAENDIGKYFERVSVVNIGSPVNWNSLRGDSIPISTTNILSVTDMGARKPDSLFKAVYLNPTCHGESLSIFARPNAKYDKKNHLLVFGLDSVPIFSEKGETKIPNRLGHDLACYTDAILKNETTSEIIKAHCNLSNQPSIQTVLPNIFGKHKQPYRYDRSLKSKDVETLVDSWGNYISSVVAVESKEVIKRRIKEGEEELSPSGSVCGDGDVIDAVKLAQRKEEHSK